MPSTHRDLTEFVSIRAALLSGNAAFFAALCSGVCLSVSIFCSKNLILYSEFLTQIVHESQNLHTAGSAALCFCLCYLSFNDRK